MRVPLRPHFSRAMSRGSRLFHIRRFSPNPGWVPGISPRLCPIDYLGPQRSPKALRGSGNLWGRGKGAMASGSTGASLV